MKTSVVNQLPLHLICFFVVLLCPALVLADAGVPLLFFTLPSMVVMLIPVVLLEAYFLRPFTSDFGTAVITSSFMNVLSTVAGFPLSFVVHFLFQLLLGFSFPNASPYLEPFSAAVAPVSPQEAHWLVPTATVASLIPAFIITLFVERFVAKKCLRVQNDGVKKAVLLGNVCSYLFLLLPSALIFSLWVVNLK